MNQVVYYGLSHSVPHLILTAVIVPILWISITIIICITINSRANIYKTHYMLHVNLRTLHRLAQSS